MSQTSIQVIERLQARIQAVLSSINPSQEPFALLDFPYYSNVGDSAIWLGEIAYFASRDLRPSYVCTKESRAWSILERAVPTGTFFINGGGNFGDIWPDHQAFREAVLTRFPDRKVVQLPQSIHFTSDAALKQCAAVIRRHPDFTLLVRDRRSLDLALNAFDCKVELCPDMAFFIGALKRPQPPSHNLVLLMRTDSEQVPGITDQSTVLPPDAQVVDWLEEPLNVWQKAKRSTLLRMPFELGLGVFNKEAQRRLYYHQLAQARLQRGLATLGAGRYVITDRLHAHILCTLLNLPHTALDNSYGKLTGFIEAWTRNCDILSLARDVPDALKQRNG